MTIAIDTNRYRDFYDNVAEVVELFSVADEIIIPLTVLGELRSGFAGGSRTDVNEAVLRAFLNKPGISTLLPDEATTHHLARIFGKLVRKGRRIPDNDLWIAALCVQHGLPLYTRDQHFKYVEGLLVI